MIRNTYHTWVITDPTGAVKYIAKPDDAEIQQYKSQGWHAHIATLTWETQK